MAKEKLQEYPTIIDASLDFEATREHFGTGNCNYAISETILNNGETAVYLHQQREGEKVVNTPMGFRRVCEHGIVICGYKSNPTGFLRFLKSPKIRTIPDAERRRVKSELVEKLRNKKPAYINFWFSQIKLNHYIFLKYTLNESKAI